MKKKKQPDLPVNIGTSSLLIIFVILCLVVFSVLSLSAAKSDYDFSKNLADRKTAYYTAANRAEEIAADIDRYLDSGKELSTYKGAKLKINGNKIEYTVDISDNQALDVILDTKGSTYSVDKWQVVSTEKRDEDDSLNLIDLE